MRLKNKLQTPAPAGKKPRRRFSPAKAAYYAFLGFMMFLMTTQPVYARVLILYTGSVRNP